MGDWIHLRIQNLGGGGSFGEGGSLSGLHGKSLKGRQGKSFAEDNVADL